MVYSRRVFLFLFLFLFFPGVRPVKAYQYLRPSIPFVVISPNPTLTSVNTSFVTDLKNLSGNLFPGGTLTDKCTYHFQ